MCHLDLPRDQFRSTEQPPPASCTTLAPPPPLSYGYGQLKLLSTPLLLASTVHVPLEQLNTPVTDVGPQRRHCRHHWKHTTDEYTRDRFRSTEGDTGAAANSHCHAWLPSGIALCHQQVRQHVTTTVGLFTAAAISNCAATVAASTTSLPHLGLNSVFISVYLCCCCYLSSTSTSTPPHHIPTPLFVFVSVPALCYVLAPSNLHCLLYAAGSLYA